MAMLHCDNILINGYKFNLDKLKGPHSVVTSKYDSMTHTYHNTTYTLDVCQPLKKSDKSKSEEQCPNGTRGMLGLCLGISNALLGTAFFFFFWIWDC